MSNVSAIRIMLSNPVYDAGGGSSRSFAWYQQILEKVARPGTTLDCVGLRKGYFSKRGTAYPDAVNAIGMAERAYEAEKKGYDAFIIGCGWDPGLKEARSLVNIPVVSPTEATLILAGSLGRTFCALTRTPAKVPEYTDLLQSYGAGDRLASVRSPREFDSQDDFELVFGGDVKQNEFVTIVLAEMRRAVKEDRAEVIWHSCTVGASVLTLQGINQVDGVPVINPLVAALKLAEVMVDMQRAFGTSVCRASIYKAPAPGWEKQRPIALD